MADNNANGNEAAALNHLDVTVVEDDESDDANESSDEFNFNDVMVCKKNLAGAFDQHATHHHAKAPSIVAQHVARFEQAVAGIVVPPVSTTTGAAKPSQKLSVSLRIRPPYSAANTSASGNSTISTVELQNSTTIRTIPPVNSQTAKSARGQSGGIKEFEFASIFGPTHSQQDVYQQLAAPMVQTLIQEEHPSSLLFTYGITNAGKTHTILGNLADANQWGILPRAMQDLCQVDGGQVKMSFLEIYNEQLLDLLAEETSTTTMAVKKSLKISGNSVVTGLTKHDVPNVQAGLELVQRAKKQRHTSSNHLNAHSSRSHSICQLELQISTMSTNATADPIDNDTPTTTKTFWIVDLAGSERSKRTGMVHSQRQREATLINASLMKLMRCLVPEGDIVPFRESKLTHFFMHHLQSGGHTSMIVNINPAPADFDETQHVLSYAVAAKVVDMIQFDVNKKSNAAATHGLDGRLLHPSKRPASDMVASKRDHRSKISQLASKFSPKKAFQRMNPANKKRKMNDEDSTNAGKVKTQHSEGTTTMNLPNFENNAEKQIKWLKTQLSIAQAETQVLKSEKENLEEELQEVESQVRLEAAEEMQAQLQVMRDEYNAMHAVRKTTTQPTPSLSTKKAQMDKAQEIMDGLVEKVEECEEEMKRMREEHVEALANQTEEHESVMTTLTSELEHLKREHLISMTSFTKAKEHEEQAWQERIEEMEEERNKMEEAWKERLQELELELEHLKDDKAQHERMWRERVEAAESELRRVEQHKSDLAERNEHLIRERCPEEENSLPLIIKGEVGSSKSQKPGGRITQMAGDSFVVSRLPFGDLANNAEDLLLPKKPAALMENGVYKRPSGRAPAGRDWDERKGAWRLSMCG
jgi:hypothetical protein